MRDGASIQSENQRRKIRASVIGGGEGPRRHLAWIVIAGLLSSQFFLPFSGISMFRVAVSIGLPYSRSSQALIPSDRRQDPLTPPGLEPGIDVGGDVDPLSGIRL
jgi:hypothetical protein